MSQCKATANRTGRQGQKRAVKGATVCLSHGGAASQARRVAAQRAALARAAELLGPDATTVDPAEVLVGAVRASAALLAAAEAAVHLDPAAVHPAGQVQRRRPGPGDPARPLPGPQARHPGRLAAALRGPGA